MPAEAVKPIRERNQALDAARGIAIIMVVAGHIYDTDTPLEKFAYSFQIPLFLIISGILMAKSRKMIPIFKYLKKRARFLLYPFAVFSVIRSIIYMFNERGLRDILQPLLLLLLFKGEGALWYLPAFFLADMLFYTLIKWNLTAISYIFLLFTIWTGFTGIYIDPANMLMPAFYLNLVNRVLIMSVLIFAGWSFEKTVSINRLRNRWIAFAAAAVLASVFWLSQLQAKNSIAYSQIGNPVRFYLQAAAGSFSVIALCENLKMPNWLIWYGKNSMTVFLTHTTFYLITLAKLIAEPLNLQPNAASITILTILVMLIEIPVIWLVNHAFPWLIRFPARS